MNKKPAIFGELRRFSSVDYNSKLASVIYFNRCNLECEYCYNLKTLRDGKSYTIDEVLESIKTYKHSTMLDGVVISGGEPSIFPDETYELIAKLHEMSYSVKVDTNGTDPNFIKKCIELSVDTVAMDYKTADYMSCNGINLSNDVINQSLDILAGSNVKYEIRITLYPGYIDITGYNTMLFNLKAKGIDKISLQDFLNENVFYKSGIEPFSQGELDYFVDKAKQLGFDVLVKFAGNYGKIPGLPADYDSE